MKNLSLILTFSLFCYACGCDQFNISFDEFDKKWFIYNPNQIFTYKNQRGEQRNYSVTVINQTKNREIKSTTPFSRCEVSYNIPTQIVNLIYPTKSDTIQIIFDKSIGSETFALVVQSKKRYTMGYLSLSSIDKLMNNGYDSLDIRGNKSSYIFKKVVLTNGKSYENVIKLTTDFNTNIYYHKTTGIIRFETDNGDIWELEN